jgi:hypothetical protein
MKIKILAATLFVILALVVSSATPALALPPLPSSFHGTVKLNGSNVPDGTHVRALINGVVYADTLTQTYLGDTVYFFNVPGDDQATPGVIEGGVEGNTIIFTIDGNDATQTGTWHTGTSVNLDLTVSPTAVILVAFSGTPQYNTIRLDWTTVTEVDLIGFNVFRSETVDGVKQKQNVSLIPAVHFGHMEGSDYQFVNTVDQGHHYFYWLELVRTGSSNDLSDPIELTTDYVMFVPLLQ